ncbi:MAG: hypothetical protein ABSF46_32630 [Terriglobia bacterium]
MTDELLTPNSALAIQQRVQSGRIGWWGPVALAPARTCLVLAVQGGLAAILWLRGNPSPWRAQAPWWTVYATLIDIGCLLLLWWRARSEGIRLRDLFGIDRSRLRWEALWGLALFLILFPIVVGGGATLASWLVYGTIHLNTASSAMGLISARHLPRWAVYYSLSVFWLVWSPTEQAIYQAYSAARLKALTGKTWVTVTVVGFWWAFQHSMFPLVLDWRLIIYRFLYFLPLIVIVQLIYLRTRALPRMIFLQWPMDLLAAWMTLRP